MKRCCLCFSPIVKGVPAVVLGCPGTHAMCAACAETAASFKRSRRSSMVLSPRSTTPTAVEPAIGGFEVDCPICGKTAKAEKLSEEEVEEKCEGTTTTAVTKSCCCICDDEKATRECSSCELQLCSRDACVRRFTALHDRLGGHRLDLIPVTQTPKWPPQCCPEHGKALELFCLEDKVPVCIMCLLICPHRQGKVSHDCCKVADAAKDLRSALEADAARLSDVSKQLEEARRSHVEAAEQVEMTRKAKISEIESKFDDLQKCLEQRRAVVLAQCNQIADRKVRAVRDHEVALRIHQEMALIESKAVAAVCQSTNSVLNVCRDAPALLDRIGSFKKVAVEERIPGDPMIEFRGDVGSLSRTIAGFGLCAATGGISVRNSHFEVSKAAPREGIVGSSVTFDVTVGNLVETSGSAVAAASERGRWMMQPIEVVVIAGTDVVASFEFSGGSSRVQVKLEKALEYAVLVRSRDTPEESKKVHSVAAVAAPPAPRIVKATDISSTSFRLSWDMSSSAPGGGLPIVFIARVCEESGKVVKSVTNILERQCTVDGLPTGTKVVVSVGAVFADATSILGDDSAVVTISPSVTVQLDLGPLLSPEHRRIIDGWLGSPHAKWFLLYRGSRDGFDPATFHQLCDGKGPTLTIIRSTGGHVFGGFTPTSWDSRPAHYIEATGKEFLFTITNPHNLPPTMYKHRMGERRQWGCFNNSCWMPCFGANGDEIALYGRQEGRCVSFGIAFEDQTCLGKNTFTGSETFKVSEIEVIAITL